MLIKIPWVRAWGNTLEDCKITNVLINVNAIVDTKEYSKDFIDPELGIFKKICLLSVRLNNGAEYPMNMLYDEGIDFLLSESKKGSPPKNFSSRGSL